MNLWKSITLRGLALTLALAALFLVGGARTAFASAGGSHDCTPWTAGSGSGAGVMHMQCVDHNVTATIDDVIPCGPNAPMPASITLTYNDVFNATELTSGVGAGTFWVTGTQTGTFNAIPYDPASPTYSGHFTTWFGDNNNLRNGSETSTFTIHATGSNGSSFTFHDVAHVSVSASGITTSFDKPTCSA